MNTETLELVVANLAGKVRRETLNGRTYIVAPLTLITPGVLNGSQGPLYYPLEELEKSYDAWNAMPIVGWHPTVDGVPVSARRPDVLNEFLLGWVFNARVDGRLTAEGWFDEDLVARFDAAKLTGRDQILPRLRSGKTIELSTGLFTENYSVPEGSVINGREYTHVARDYRPDHLAILPDQTGACSVADGCGVHVTAVANEMHGGGGGGMGADVAKAVGKSVRQLTSEALEDGMHHHFLADDPEAAARKAADYLADMGDVEVSGEAGIWTVTLEEPAGGDETEEHMFHFVPSSVANYSTDQPRDDAGRWDGGGEGGDRTHSVDLPKNPKKLNIPTATAALTQMGYSLGQGQHDLKTKATVYQLTKPDGSTARVTTDEIKEIVYRGRSTRNAEGEDVAENVLERMWDSVVNAVLGQPKSKNTGRYKPLGAGTGRGEVHEAAQSGALTVTDDDLRLGADAARELAEAGHNPASWVEDEDLWEKAKEAARKSGKYDEGSEQFWAVVTSIYKKMGGGVKSEDATTNSEEPPADHLPPPETEEMNKAQKVQFLTANCNCWKNKAGTLNGMTDADVDQFYAAVVKSKEDAQVANAVRQKYAPAVKEATGAEPTANSIAQFVVNSTAVTNAGKCPECGKMTMNEKTGVCANCGYEMKTDNAKDDPEDAADGGADESEETPSGKKKKMNTNATPSVAEQVKAYMGGLTEKQWLELAPAGIRAGVQNALESDREARHGFVDALVRNISNEDDRKAAAAEYLRMPTKTLKLLAANAKPAQAGAGKPDESEVDQFIRNYYGAQGGPARVNNGESLSDEEALANPLPRPTINYEELSPIGPGGHRRTA